jgi:imidazolonepropionase-like amidohydrolase
MDSHFLTAFAQAAKETSMNLQRHSVCSLALVGIVCSCSQQRGFDLAIVGATLIDGTDRAPQPDRLILVRNGAVVEIADATARPMPVVSEVIDASGQYVIPGLADMHVHFGSGGLGPRRNNATERAVHQFLQYGVTTVLNVGGTGGNLAQVRSLRKRQRAGATPGLRIFATGDMLTLPGSHPVATIMRLPDGVDPATYDWSSRGVALVSNVERARAAVARNIEGGMNAIKIIVESGPTEFGEHPQMPPEMILAVVDEAARLGGFVVAHISSLDEFEDCIDAGVHAIIHAVCEPPFPSSEHWAAMKAKGIYYVPTLSLYGSLLSTLWSEPSTFSDPFLTGGVSASTLESVKGFGPGPSFAETAEEEWKQILQSVNEAHVAGVLLALGTDTNNPRVYPGYSVHRELETLVQLGLSPQEAIIAATRRPAELLGSDDELGTVEVGKRADLLILGANPLDDIRNTRTLQTVILNGQIIRRATR